MYPLATCLYQCRYFCYFVVMLFVLWRHTYSSYSAMWGFRGGRKKVWGHGKSLTRFVGERSRMDTPTQTQSVLKAMYRKPLVSGLKIQDKMAPDMTRGSVMSFNMTVSVPVWAFSLYSTSSWLVNGFLSKSWYFLNIFTFCLQKDCLTGIKRLFIWIF